MTPKRISGAVEMVPVRVVVLTLNGHVAQAVAAAERQLRPEIPGLSMAFHAATDWDRDPASLERCVADIGAGDIVLVNMMFLEPHIRAVMPALVARRPHCDAMLCFMSAGEIVRLTRVGKFSMDGSNSSGMLSFLKRLRGKSGKGGAPGSPDAGAKQMAMLRRLPKILKFVPGTAQDVRAYFLAMQFWLAGSDENFAGMVRLLVGRYASGPRAHLVGRLAPAAPVDYPDVGLYHPKLPARIATDLLALPARGRAGAGTVGLLVMRSYVLSGDTGHYDGVIAAMEARGLTVVPAFASGLDSRAAIRTFFMAEGRATVDALVCLTGFSLVGGPAYNDAAAAEAMLAELDVPCIQAQAVEFQTVEDWRASDTGLSPVEATMMVAIPEIDGSTAPIVFGGRGRASAPGVSAPMRADAERCSALARRVAKQVALRRSALAERRVAIVLFNFPPNAGAAGTAAFLSVFRSLLNVLRAMKAEGYAVDVPDSVDALRARVLEGNAARHGMPANVAAFVPAEDHVAREPHLAEIEAQWGPAPGRAQADGRHLFVLGAAFGNVFVGLQPAFGYEGDPMRLLFERGFAPTHAFSAFYRYIRDDFAAHAVLHFGTHGALEFMPGKQVGLSDACWPERLIGDLPNLYLYAANNPSEGAIAKRRSAATLVSYLTPPVTQAGLYRGLVDVKGLVERWRGLPGDASGERAELAPAIQAAAAALDLAPEEPAWTDASLGEVETLRRAVEELEQTLIPHGLHAVGEPPTAAERADLLATMAEMAGGDAPSRDAIEAITVARVPPAPDAPAELRELARIDALLRVDHELPALMRALDGRFVRPAPGGDLVRNPAVLPTGRNLHGFDPFRIPSAFAVDQGRRQAEQVLARYLAESHRVPETVALVLWGTDNLKSEGGPIAQALALLGAVPRFDSFGRLCGAALVPLAEMARPRIDVLMTLSGIFRDLLPLQTTLLAEAAWLAATADEPTEANFVRKHALRYQREAGCDMETAALRVFSNADGTYGSNVNHLVDAGAWQGEGELGQAFAARKSFAYDRRGRSAQQSKLMQAALADVDLAYQNLESVELGVTTIDHYFDSLGGVSRAAASARGGAPVPVYIADATRGAAKVRSLGEQVALETRSRSLNPKWYEAMLEHGSEGVRQIESQVTNTMGWSATTGQVDPWVYRRLAETFVLDGAMRERLASLNPVASARVANRLIEAQERRYWTPTDAELDALRAAGDELEDRLEGIVPGRAVNMGVAA
ncbi:magnesium chelatase subunit H [Lichenibacterium minor]|uniref:magnesium chelatase n=1 Tax=Lichenibacterium minor TaxID=2316528 RepID=A0A4Q2UES0_9HYPH|nr:magnesium chelatase subunit H [Lichenibacterium minor]RYC33727.1 magnesium chelatase subunit H [Lichenibacterium minor]